MDNAQMIRTIASTLLIALTLAATPALAQAQRPDTEFCAKMRAKDPGGICTPKGEYVTAEKVYLPDGKIINRTTGG
jgi:hypothetical protein